MGEIAQGTGDFAKARAYYERALEAIERKISRIERKLRGPLTVEQYGRLRSELMGLRSWRELVRERLEALP